jgi:hypothetical protein
LQLTPQAATNNYFAAGSPATAAAPAAPAAAPAAVPAPAGPASGKFRGKLKDGAYPIPKAQALQMLAGRPCPCGVAVDVLLGGALALQGAACSVKMQGSGGYAACFLAGLVQQLASRPQRALRYEAPAAAGGRWRVVLEAPAAGAGRFEGGGYGRMGRRVEEEAEEVEEVEEFYWA